MKKTIKKILLSILRFEARIILKKYKPGIVAITGSVGKTSTKDAIHAAIASAYSARKSEKNYNTEIGIISTIIGAKSGPLSLWRWLENMIEALLLILIPFYYPRWLVLEVAADSDNKKFISTL